MIDARAASAGEITVEVRLRLQEARIDVGGAGAPRRGRAQLDIYRRPGASRQTTRP